VTISLRIFIACPSRPLLPRRICPRVRSRLWIAAGPLLLPTEEEILISVSRGFSPPPETQRRQALLFLAAARITCCLPRLVYLQPHSSDWRGSIRRSMRR